MKARCCFCATTISTGYNTSSSRIHNCSCTQGVYFEPETTSQSSQKIDDCEKYKTYHSSIASIQQHETHFII